MRTVLVMIEWVFGGFATRPTALLRLPDIPITGCISARRPIRPWRTGGAPCNTLGHRLRWPPAVRKSPTNHVTAKANLPATRLCHVAHREITTSLDGRIAPHRSAAAAAAAAVVPPVYTERLDDAVISVRRRGPRCLVSLIPATSTDSVPLRGQPSVSFYGL